MTDTQPQQAEEHVYNPGIISDIAGLAEVAGSFGNVRHFGLEYSHTIISLGEFDPKTGSVTSHGRYTLMPIVSETEALRILKQERDMAFSEGFAPKVALVVNGKVMVRGEPR